LWRLLSRADGEEGAAQIGRSIANSPLVKTALAGEDANWGRILCAAGYSGIPFDPDRVEIKIGDLVVCKRGTGALFNEADAKQILRQRDIRIALNLHAGSSSATLWTCDLTKEYIHINADYRT
jgi:glutamate N-acetyltransferase/amino-acid N-acetyltransferase